MAGRQSIVLLAFAAFLLGCGGPIQRVSPAVGGVLDLRAVGLEAGTVPLNGQWRFAWQKFVSPNEAEFPGNDLLEIPRPWNQRADLAGMGFSSYELTILLPERSDVRMLALRVPDLNTSYRLYLNGELLNSVGEAGPTAQSSVPAFRPDIITFPYQSKLKLLVHVANFSHRKGGLDETIRLGTATQIRAEHEGRTAQAFFVFGCILVAGLFDLFRFLLRPSDRRSLLFALFCVCLAVRTLVTGQYVVVWLWPTIPFSLLLRLEYLTLYLAVPLVAAFFREQYPAEFQGRIRNVFVLVSLVLAAIVMTTPLSFYSHTLLPMFGVLVAYILYAVVNVIRAALAARQGAPALLLGGIFFAVTVLLDILHNQYLLRSAPSLAPYGFLVFVFSQSYILVQNSANAYRTVERLSTDLESRVRERTRELEESKGRLQRTFSELEEARDRAEESSRMKSEFVAVMSHEIRTPLASIIGISQILGETSLNAEQRELSDVLQRAAQNLSRLIDDILDFSRIEAGRLTLNEAPFDVRAVTENVFSLMELRASQKGLRLEKEIRRLPEEDLVGDASRLEQILINLVGNAVKFTEHGLVHLQVVCIYHSPERAHIRFRVADTGIGIDPGLLDRVFDSFTQADSSSTRRYEGTGLGLAISRRLASLMGGSIRVESLPGEGSLFTLELPFGKAPKKQAASPRAPTALPARLSVLVAEDNPDNRLLLRHFLKDQPIRLEEVEDGQAALDAVQTGEFDVVLMDVRMPVMDGYEAVRRIRQWEEATGRRPIAILALTANASDQDVGRSLEAGCNEHLSKPVDRQRLLDALASYIPSSTPERIGDLGGR